MAKQRRQTIFRVARRRSYTLVSNDLLRDRSLSLSAKGLLAQVLSFPDDWEFDVGHMATVCKDSEKRVRRALNELIGREYARRIRIVDRRTGQTLRWVTSFYESRDACLAAANEVKELSLFELEVDAGPAPLIDTEVESDNADPHFYANTPVGQIPDCGNPLSGFGQQQKNEELSNDRTNNNTAPVTSVTKGTSVPCSQETDVVVVGWIEAGFTRERVDQLLSAWGVQRMTKALRCLQQQRTTPRNPQGFITQALKLDWDPPKAFDIKAESERLAQLLRAKRGGAQ